MNRAEEKRTGRQHPCSEKISFKKELEVEELKIETPETLYVLVSLGAQFGKCWGKGLKFLSESI